MSLATLPARVPHYISDTNTTHPASRGVYCGTAGDYKLYDSVTKTWCLHKGMVAGAFYPLQDMTGVTTSADAAVTSGDVVFYIG